LKEKHFLKQETKIRGEGKARRASKFICSFSDTQAILRRKIGM
jgi:hypothetical protein